MKAFIRKIPPLYKTARRIKNQLQYLKEANKIKRLIKSNSAIKIVVGAAGKCMDGWILTEISVLNLLNPKHWDFLFK